MRSVELGLNMLGKITPLSAIQISLFLNILIFFYLLNLSVASIILIICKMFAVVFVLLYLRNFIFVFVFVY